MDVVTLLSMQSLPSVPQLSSPDWTQGLIVFRNLQVLFSSVFASHPVRWRSGSRKWRPAHVNGFNSIISAG